MPVQKASNLNPNRDNNSVGEVARVYEEDSYVSPCDL